MTVDKALRKLQFVKQRIAPLTCEIENVFSRIFISSWFVLPSVNINYSSFFHKFARTQNSFAEGYFPSFPSVSWGKGRRFNEVFIKIRSGRNLRKVVNKFGYRKWLPLNRIDLPKAWHVTSTVKTTHQAVKLFFHCFLT